MHARENVLLVGPSGTGKSHALVGCGVLAVERGMKVRYLVAADLIETLYRGLADNTVGKVISGLLRNELILIDEVMTRYRRHDSNESTRFQEQSNVHLELIEITARTTGEPFKCVWRGVAHA